MQPVPPPDPEAKIIPYEYPDGTVLPVEVVAEFADYDGEQIPTRLDVCTVWQPDEGERKALANGAPIILRIEGPPLDPTVPARQQMPQQPPCYLAAGEPGANAQPLIEWSHLMRTLGAFFGVLAEPFPETKGPGFVVQHFTADGQNTTVMLTPGLFIDLFGDAIEATRDIPGRGDGASITDIALPGDVRRDL
jgi:hypothetical protein